MQKIKIILTLIFTLNFCMAFAHSDFYRIEDFGNVKVRITTGFNYEEINKVFLLGQLAEQFAKQLNYSEPIFLDFSHYYVGNCEPDYFISYDKGKIHYTWNKKSNEKDFLQNNSIVIRQVSRHFDAQTTLKLLEYAILNIDNIKSFQKKIEYKKNYCQWNINSIDTTLIKKMLDEPNSIQVNQILNFKIERDKDFKYGVLYYLQDNKYTIFYRGYDGDRDLITLDNVYDFKRIDYAYAVVFDTDSSFYFINHKVSDRHIIQDTDGYYRPYKIEYMGGNKVSIYFYDCFIINKNRGRNLIYLMCKDELIQDLDKLINKE